LDDMLVASRMSLLEESVPTQGLLYYSSDKK
jgi:hypothetical protein